MEAKPVSRSEESQNKTPPLEVFSNKPAGEVNPLLEGDILGRLRRELIWTIGELSMIGILTRSGFSYGLNDAYQKSKNQALFEVIPGLKKSLAKQQSKGINI